jgi:Arc/MetJ family transcription regulator
MIAGMTRITVEIDDEWLHDAQQVLGTGTKVATINEALRLQALRAKAARIIEALDSAEAEMDFTHSAESFRYGGGRDLSKLEERARIPRVA